MKIVEVSEQYGISLDTLRYYERIGLIPPVTRNESGIRDYNELDIRWVEFVKYFMTRAYSTAQASVIAPFEYASLPISILWGFLFWREIPAGMTIAGAALTLLSGLYILVQEQKKKPISDQLVIDNAALENEA